MSLMVERRKSQRYALHCPVQYKYDTDERRDYSIVLNMGEGGALIYSNKFVGPSASVIIKLFFKNEEFFIRARVIHVERMRNSDFYSVGIEFMESPLNFIRQFYNELAVIMFYQREYGKESGDSISLEEASERWYRTDPS